MRLIHRDPRQSLDPMGPLLSLWLHHVGLHGLQVNVPAKVALPALPRDREVVGAKDGGLLTFPRDFFPFSDMLPAVTYFGGFWLNGQILNV